ATRRPFALGVVGLILCAVGLFFSPDSWAKTKGLYAKIASLCRRPTPVVVTDPHAEKLAELRRREQVLLARKAALKPGDTVAAEALARDIEGYNVELKAALAGTPPVAPARPNDLWTMNPTAAAMPLTPVS